MSSQTRRALEDFDNQHDFERLSADVLNALGYSHVEPMAPRGGADGGKDIRFHYGSSLGIALVTLNKKIADKFQQDLEQQDNDVGLIALFCNVDVTPAMKLGFTRDALAKGFMLEIFDLERMRSLLDSRLQDLRRRYLHIDDETAERLRAEVHKLLAFPDAVPDESPVPTKLEGMLKNRLPSRLFDLLMRFQERDVLEVPGIGAVLHAHLRSYYEFRKTVLAFERAFVDRIAAAMGPELSFPRACDIHLKYGLQRFFGNSKEQVRAQPNFLNYGITWDSAEQMFERLSVDSALSTEVANLGRRLEALLQGMEKLAPTDVAGGTDCRASDAQG